MAELPTSSPRELVADEPVELATEPPEQRFDTGPRTLREHTAQGAIINSLFQVGFAGLGLLQRLVVAAFLTTAEYGLWGVLVTTLITLAWLKQIGISDKYVQQEGSDQELAFQRAFSLELAYTSLFFVVIALALPVYALIYGRAEIIVPGLILSLALMGSALQTPIWIAYRQMRFLRQRTLESVDPLISLVVTIVLAATGFGYWSLVIGVVAGSLGGATVALVTCPYRLAWRFDRGTLREYFSFSWPLVASSGSSLVVVQGAILVGNYTVGLTGIGAIALASNFSMFADRIDAIIRRTIYPAVCSVKDRSELLFEVFIKSNRLALMWALPFGVGLALFAPDLVTYVLGERWREAEILLQAFGLILAFRQVAFNWVVFFSAIGNTRPMAVNGVLQLIVFFAVTMPLMIMFGLNGYAIGMGVSVVLEIALRSRYLARLFDGFQVIRHILRAVAPSVPAVGSVLAVRFAFWPERSVSIVLLELAVYAVVTVIATVLFERRLLSELYGYLRRAVRPRQSPLDEASAA